MIYIDGSVALAQLLTQDHALPETIWWQPLISSRLLEYEVWNRIHARGLARSHGDADVRDQRNSSIRIKKRARGREAHPKRDGSPVLYGWHTVKAALENPQRRIRRLFATENAARRLAEEGVPLRAELELVRPEMIARRLSPDAVHNGVLAEADPLPSPELDEIAADLMLVLDQITDPHNVGAILRTAAAFDVGAVLTTARHSPQASGALAKSASGQGSRAPRSVGASEETRWMRDGAHRGCERQRGRARAPARARAQRAR